MDTPPSTPLIRKLESILVLSDEERDVLRNVSGTIKTVGPRQDLVREGDRPHECCLILEGFAYSYKLTETGKRAIQRLVQEIINPAEGNDAMPDQQLADVSATPDPGRDDIDHLAKAV